MRRLLRLLSAAAVSFSVISIASSALALDTRYVDADGDLVADTPTEPTKLIDPPTLIFTYTPAEDPAVYVKVWEDFLKHLERVTGKKVQWLSVRSNAAQIEAMRAGRLHVTGFNTGATPLAVNCAGFVPFTLMGTNDGDYGYRMQIITYPDSGIDKIEDINGKKIAFTSETSNSGYKVPTVILREVFQMEPGKHYESVFSGRHDNSVIGVANKDYPAAAVASEIMNRMISRGVVKKEQIKILYESERFPTAAYGYVSNLKSELQERIKQAFFTFDWTGSALEAEFSKMEPPGERFVPITYEKHWAQVREIDRLLNIEYTCR